MSCVDRLLPPALRTSDAETLRRARLVAGFTLALSLGGAANTVQFLVRYSPLTFWTLFGGTMLSALALVVLRLTRSITLAAHWLIGALWLTVTTTVATVGGIESPGYFWTVVSVLFAVTLVGRRGALVWVAAALGQLAIGFWTAKHGDLPPVPTAQHDRALVIACATALAGVYFIARFHEERMRALVGAVDAARCSAESAHQAARLVLDNVGQGLFLVDSKGALIGTTSKAMTDWFGDLKGASTIHELFAIVAPQCGPWLAAGYDDVFLDVLPPEVVLGQLPSKFERAGRHYTIEYRTIEIDGKVANVLLVLTDVTDVVLAERAEEEQRELLLFVRAIGRDRGALHVVLDELRERAARIVEGRSDAIVERRDLHTLKGSSAMLGLTRTARFCHDLEDQAHSGLDEAQRRALADHFAEVERRIAPFLGERAPGIELSEAEHEILLREATRSGSSALVTMVRGLADELTRQPLALFAREARSLAARLGRSGLNIELADNGLRLPRERFAALWAALSHVTRNAIDHGIEQGADRVAAGKPEVATLALSTCVEDDEIVIEIRDDGRGIDWERLASRAREQGHAAASHDDLVAALFADGVSTRDRADELSGRGVGLAAARAAALELGGRVEVDSQPEKGTRFRFRIPAAVPAAPAARAA